MGFTLIGTAVGLGTAVYGASQQRSQIKKSNQATAKANALNAKVAEQQKLAAEASVRAEQQRLQQMELEGIRRRRDIIRQAQGARALGIARANASGANTTDSSVQAGQQQLANTQRADTLANLQNIQIGRNIYAENQKIYDAQTKGATIQSQANNYLSQAQQYQNAANYSQQIFGAGIQIAQGASTFNNVMQTALSGARDIFNPNPWQTNTYANVGGTYRPLK